MERGRSSTWAVKDLAAWKRRKERSSGQEEGISIPCSETLTKELAWKPKWLPPCQFQAMTMSNGSAVEW
jgi:hypothetical protein